MSLFGGPNVGSTMQGGYNQANQYLQPFYSGGTDAYNQYNSNMSQMGKDLSPYSGAGSSMYDKIDQDPQEYYNNIMKGYSQSPQAAQQMSDMTKATDNAAAASGMMGSGSFYNDMQKNAQGITSADQQQYYNNVMGSNNQQMQYLQNLQGQQQQYNSNLNGLAGQGYNAGSQMGNNDIQSAQAKAMQQMMQHNSLISGVGGIAGTALSFL